MTACKEALQATNVREMTDIGTATAVKSLTLGAVGPAWNVRGTTASF